MFVAAGCYLARSSADGSTLLEDAGELRAARGILGAVIVRRCQVE